MNGIHINMVIKNMRGENYATPNNHYCLYEQQQKHVLLPQNCMIMRPVLHHDSDWSQSFGSKLRILHICGQDFVCLSSNRLSTLTTMEKNCKTTDERVSNLFHHLLKQHLLLTMFQVQYVLHVTVRLRKPYTAIKLQLVYRSCSN